MRSGLSLKEAISTLALLVQLGGSEEGGGEGNNLYLSFSSQRHKSSSFMACVHSLRHGGLIAYEFSQDSHLPLGEGSILLL